MSNQSEPLDRKALLKNALIALDEMQSRLDAMEHSQHEPIAIIGIGCRFPGDANSPDAYWKLLHDGVDAIQTVPPSAGISPSLRTSRWATRFPGMVVLLME